MHAIMRGGKMDAGCWLRVLNLALPCKYCAYVMKRFVVKIIFVHQLGQFIYMYFNAHGKAVCHFAVLSYLLNLSPSLQCFNHPPPSSNRWREWQCRYCEGPSWLCCQVLH